MMDIGPSLVTDAQSPELSQPSQGALHYPAVPTESGLWLDADPGNAAGDAAGLQGQPTARVVVPLVGRDLRWPLAALTARRLDGRHGIKQRLEHDAVIDVGTRQADRQWNAIPVHDQVAF